MDNTQSQTVQPSVVNPPPVVPPPPTAKPSKIKIPIVFAVIFFFLIVGASIFAVFYMENSVPKLPRDTAPLGTEKPKAVEVCPKDTKKCPNGITVPRLAPKCDFAPCTGKGAPVATPTPAPATPTLDLNQTP